MQVLVNMIITILFANEENLSCLEGLIVQPVFQAFLGFLVMATAVVDTPSKFTSVFVYSLIRSLLRRHLVPAQHHHDGRQLALLLLVRSKRETMERGVLVTLQVRHNSHVNHLTGECPHWTDNANVPALGELRHWRIITETSTH